VARAIRGRDNPVNSGAGNSVDCDAAAMGS
jgi:hypothetical protein